jgi:signal transduction histidine kinase
VLLGIVMSSAMGLAALTWRLLFGPVPINVPVTVIIVAPVVALPLILYLQLVIHRLEESRRALTRLTADLTIATEEAETASRAKTEFLARMSHELRTPLNAVIGYSEMLLEDAESGHGISNEHAADMRRIHSAGRHLLAMVNDVLDLSKIEAGRMDLLAQPIDLAPFIDDVAATSRRFVAMRGNELRVERAADLGMMTGDATKLRQVTLNLLSNAAKFTENGCVTLAAAREPAAGGDWIAITVSDTGIGIDRDTLGRLFTNFTQADASIAARFGGTGLGLALSRKLCRLMGGDITAESELGRGSRFTLRVPAGEESRQPSAVSRQRAES